MVFVSENLEINRVSSCICTFRKLFVPVIAVDAVLHNTAVCRTGSSQYLCRFIIHKTDFCTRFVGYARKCFFHTGGFAGNRSRKVAACSKCGCVCNVCNIAPFTRYGKTVYCNHSLRSLCRTVVRHLGKSSDRCFIGDVLWSNYKSALYCVVIFSICGVRISFDNHIISSGVYRRCDCRTVLFICNGETSRNIRLDCKALRESVILKALRSLLDTDRFFYDVFPDSRNRRVTRNADRFSRSIFFSVHAPRSELFLCRRSKRTFRKFIISCRYADRAHRSASAARVKRDVVKCSVDKAVAFFYQNVVSIACRNCKLTCGCVGNIFYNNIAFGKSGAQNADISASIVSCINQFLAVDIHAVIACLDTDFCIAQ